MMDLADQIKGYARSNTDPAAVGPSPLDDSPLTCGGRRSTSHLVLTACLVLLVACAASAIFAASRQHGSTGPTTASTQPSPLGPHPEAMQEAAELAASGWAHFSDDDPYVGPPVADAYVPVGQGGPPAEYDPVLGRVPVYSDVNRTTLLGYLYSGIGFVPADYANSGAFTPEISKQIRIDAFGGCDPLAGENCPVWVKPHLRDAN